MATNPAQARDIASRLPTQTSVVKAQIHAGGRGKGGGVKVCRGLKEIRENVRKILGMKLVTRQTGPQGQKVLQVLVEEGIEIPSRRELRAIVEEGLDGGAGPAARAAAAAELAAMPPKISPAPLF